ncbi:hypothetical protein GCM10007418_31740 [Halopseudomonas salina]|uniref:Uncharacterized protein n=1 Tax=Halopseudomonas salina TaxID=1323744 RepID=A0ABQ1Q2T3_9GAMM|nr:hypothetical protein GCM10007418_31740 [Halopseudomonas salina]
MLAATQACKANRWYRGLTWLALGAMLLGGMGAALAHKLGLDWVGGFERITQSGYHSWLLITAVMGLSRSWSQS